MTDDPTHSTLLAPKLAFLVDGPLGGLWNMPQPEAQKSGLIIGEAPGADGRPREIHYKRMFSVGGYDFYFCGEELERNFADAVIAWAEQRRDEIG